MNGLRLSGSLTQPTRSVTGLAGDGEAASPASALTRPPPRPASSTAAPASASSEQPAAHPGVTDP